MVHRTLVDLEWVIHSNHRHGSCKDSRKTYKVRRGPYPVRLSKQFAVIIQSGTEANLLKWTIRISIALGLQRTFSQISEKRPEM